MKDMLRHVVAQILRKLRKRSVRSVAGRAAQRPMTQQNQVKAPHTLSYGECEWDYYPSSTIAQPTAFVTHDNGGRPFAVVVTASSISVRRQGNSKAWNALARNPTGTPEDILVAKQVTRFYPTVVVPPIKYVKVFVGRDSMCMYNHNFVGNSVLAELPSAGPKRAYLHVGGGVVSLYELDDVITGYASPVPNNDVSEEFAVGQKNLYLFGLSTYIPNAMINTGFNNPYHQAIVQGLQKRYKLTPAWYL